MEFKQAKKEFENRYYLWATSEWEKEIDELLPNLSSFKSGSFWETYQFMKLLDKHHQRGLARGLLKRFHRNAVESLGENPSAEEERLRGMRDGFFDIRQMHQFVQQLKKEDQLDVAEFWMNRLRAEANNVPGIAFFNDDKFLLLQLAAVFDQIPVSFEEEIEVRRRTGEKFRFAGKRKLQNVITEKFKEAFAGQIINHDYDDLADPSTNFDMICCGWILRTNFWFGRRQNLINYAHSIGSPTKIHHERYPDITVSAFQLAMCISLSSWLGITSQVEWTYISNKEVEPICDTVINHCRHFFEVLPKLLKGLEFEKITTK